MNDLPALLRGCVRWRGDRPWVDNDALLVVADWCEENARGADADAIRHSMTWEEDEYQGEGGVYFFMHLELEVTSGVHVDDQFSKARAFVDFVSLQDINWPEYAAIYSLERDERDELGGLGRTATSPGFSRILSLARWDGICRMLGYPLIRLVGDEQKEVPAWLQ